MSIYQGMAAGIWKRDIPSNGSLALIVLYEIKINSWHLLIAQNLSSHSYISSWPDSHQNETIRGSLVHDVDTVKLAISAVLLLLLQQEISMVRYMHQLICLAISICCPRPLKPRCSSLGELDRKIQSTINFATNYLSGPSTLEVGQVKHLFL